jgi:hypothetical protein
MDISRQQLSVNYELTGIELEPKKVTLKKADVFSVMQEADISGKRRNGRAIGDGKTTELELSNYLDQLKSNPHEQTESYTTKIKAAEFILQNYEQMKDIVGKSFTTDGRDAGLNLADIDKISAGDGDKTNLSTLDLYPELSSEAEVVDVKDLETLMTKYEPDWHEGGLKDGQVSQKEITGMIAKVKADSSLKESEKEEATGTLTHLQNNFEDYYKASTSVFGENKMNNGETLLKLNNLKDLAKAQGNQDELSLEDTSFRMSTESLTKAFDTHERGDFWNRKDGLVDKGELYAMMQTTPTGDDRTAISFLYNNYEKIVQGEPYLSKALIIKASSQEGYLNLDDLS